MRRHQQLRPVSSSGGGVDDGALQGVLYLGLRTAAGVELPPVPTATTARYALAVRDSNDEEAF